MILKQVLTLLLVFRYDIWNNKYTGCLVIATLLKLLLKEIVKSFITKMESILQELFPQLFTSLRKTFSCPRKTSEVF